MPNYVRRRRWNALFPRGLALLIAVLTPVVAAARETFDAATFEPPVGWVREASPGLLLFRSATGAGQIVLFPSRLSEASPIENFEADWARLVTAALGPVDTPQLTTQQKADGWTGVIGAVNVTRQGGAFTILQVTATGFGRTMSIMANLAGAEHVDEVTRFFEGIEYRVDAPGRPAPATTGETRPPSAPREGGAAQGLTIAPGGVEHGKPTGLYYRLSGGSLDGRGVGIDIRLFLPGDRITRTFPYGGGDTFDESARCLPDTCGRYRADGGHLAVTWDGGQVDRWPLAHTSEGVSLDGTTFRPARSVAAAVLVGEWVGAPDAGASFSNTYRFQSDGTFTFGSGSTGVAGRYAVQGFTLILNFADGSESRRTLFAAGKSEPVGLICVEGDVYARR